MNILTLHNVKKEFNAEVLFKDISFDINSNEKVALIGKNGTGKSTLLKMILNDQPIDEGTININNKSKIGYLSQTVITSTSNSLKDEMLEVYKETLRTKENLKKLAKKLKTDPNNQQLLNQYANLEHNFFIQGGYEYHYKIETILTKFGFTKEMFKRPITTFSGGEKTRIAFAKLLLINPDLLILDEPTNHLDIEIIEWLEDYLSNYNGAVLLVTHDKYFISKVCRKIIEIDQRTAHVYHGTFKDYEEEKRKRYELLLKQYKHQQKEIAHLQSFIDRFRYNAKRASIAKDRQKKIDRMDKIDRPTQTKRQVKMTMQDGKLTDDVILKAKNVSIGYDEPLLSNINFSMRGFDKLAIIGPNGTGKTTLLKVIEGKLPIFNGKINFLKEFKIGYFDQNQSTLNYHKTVFEEIHDYHPTFTIEDVRGHAARFLFYGDDLDKKISILSGGEKVRLVLLLLMLNQPELLVLDEPTNHLDIETKSIIEDVFDTFNGPIIFVSHDRYFINKIGTKLLYIHNDKMTEFEGSYDDYKEKLLNEKNRKKQKKSTKKSNKKATVKDKIKALESSITSLEKEIESLKESTYKEENIDDYDFIYKTNKKIEQLTKELVTKEETYFALLETQEEVST